MLDLLNQIFLRRVERDREQELNDPHHPQPIYSPFAPMIETVKSLSTRPGLIFIALMIALAIFWLVA